MQVFYYLNLVLQFHQQLERTKPLYVDMKLTFFQNFYYIHTFNLVGSRNLDENDLKVIQTHSYHKKKSRRFFNFVLWMSTSSVTFKNLHTMIS
jgi:hypothetical protein